MAESKKVPERYAEVKNSTYSEKERATNTGFYFDAQIEDPLLSISLHPNTEPGDDGHSDGWQLCTGDTLEKTLGGKNDTYRRKPIARALLTEDFIYSITNNFSELNGGNPIEDLFNSFKPYAPIIEQFASGLGKGAESMKEDDMGAFMVSKANKFAKWIAPKLSKAGGFLNNALLVQGTRFSYYNGTSFNFNNMELKYTAFSDWVDEEFQDVYTYINEVKPYVMGIYHPVTSDLTGTDVDKYIEEYVGYQVPPAGFRMETKTLGNILRGTMRLNIGGMYAISNLVIKNMTVNVSKVQAKDPRDPGKTVPLYAEITLQLTPASAIVDNGFDAIINHKGVKEDIINAVAVSYQNKMEDLKAELKTRLNSMDSKVLDDLRVQMDRKLKEEQQKIRQKLSQAPTLPLTLG